MAVELALQHGMTYRVCPAEAPTLRLSGASGGEAAWASAAGGSGSVTIGADGSVDLPDRPAPDLLELTWEGAGATGACLLQVVGTHMAELGAILRHGGDQGRPLDVAATEADAWRARARAEALMEGACGRAFVPVMVREVAWPERDGSAMLRWPDATRVADPEGARLLNRAGWVLLPCGGPRRVAYVHGMAACPPDAAWAVEELAASYLVHGPVPYRAVSASTSDGVVSYSIAGRDGATGIPEVDEVIARHRIRRHLVG